MVLKIIYDKKECIGAGECEAISPKLWKLSKGKADLAGATLNAQTGKYELVITDSLLKEQETIVGSCPAGCIHIVRS